MSSATTPFRGEFRRGFIEGFGLMPERDAPLPPSAANSAAASLKGEDRENQNGMMSSFRGEFRRGFIEGYEKLRPTKIMLAPFRGEFRRGFIEGVSLLGLV